ncbi:MAG: hypothetical protein WDO72_05330 [Pseudomonadota bacterium]
MRFESLRRNTALALGFFCVSTLAAGAARPPAPTNVAVTAVEGIDKALGAFILEWTPPIDDTTGKPYAKYSLSAGCKYESIDGNASAGPTGISGLWAATFTAPAPRYRLKVTCSCVVAPYRYNAIATAGTNPYMGSSAWVNTEKFLIPCGGK